MVVGATLQCSSFELGQLIAARLLTGFGNGMVSSFPSVSTISGSEIFLEHIYGAYVAIRNIESSSQRPDGDD